MFTNRPLFSFLTPFLFSICLIGLISGANQTLAAEKPTGSHTTAKSAPHDAFAYAPVLSRLHPHPADGYGTTLLDGHFCGTDFSSEKSRLALEQYRRDKEAGLYPIASKGSQTPGVVGDERSFNVSENNVWMPLEFRLVEVTSLYNLWVEIAELNNGNVTASKIASFHQVALDSSPSRSIDPGKGFFANNHTVYGLPPDVDGDGLVDLLMYDIGRGTGSTLGYVSPQDLIVGGDPSEGNGRDILYLDSDQGTSNFTLMAAIAAHEYTHLIHQAYGSDETFLSEGYAEFSSDFNGYFWRLTTYFLFPEDVSQNLFTWRTSGGPSARDYERAGLFITYLGSRVGTMAVGEMLRSTKKGAGGIDSLLQESGQNLADVVRDFHTANFFNDRSLDPLYGYVELERSAHHAFLSSAPINGERQSTTSEEGGYFDSFITRINTGAVVYRRYNNVADIFLKYDVPIDPIFGDATQIAARNRNAAKIAFQRAGSATTEFIDVAPSSSTVSISGQFDWVLFILAHTNPGLATGDRTKFEMTWTPLSKATDSESEVALPQAVELGANYPNPFNPQTLIPVSLQSAQNIELDVVDVLGKRMALISKGMQPAGQHTFNLDAASWPSGTYLVRLKTASGIQTRLITLIK